MTLRLLDLESLHGLASEPAAARLRTLARRSARDVDRIATAMYDAYVLEIPAYTAITDPALRDDVIAVSAALVRAWLEMMSSGAAPSADALLPIQQGARRRAAQGIEMQAMLRAYRVGVRVMWHALTSSPDFRDPVLQGTVVQLAEWALDFADRVNNEVTAVYLDEMTHATREREHRRSALLNVILAGPGSDAAAEPGELDRPHAIVVTRVPEDLDLAALERIGTTLEKSGGAALWTVRHRSVIGAVPYGSGATRAELLRRLAGMLPAEGISGIGVGGNARGARETRQSYSEAVEALRVGPVLGDVDVAVYDYQRMAPSISLLTRPDQARRFVATALEPLGRLVEKAWVLPTLEAYLARQGHTKEAAQLLGVHLNTVKYRLRELRESTGAVLLDGEMAGSLLLALKLRRLLDAEGL
ncbi:MAG: PucR family transcriptional regulator [Candidatus Dormibacteria bacterium]